MNLTLKEFAAILESGSPTLHTVQLEDHYPPSDYAAGLAVIHNPFAMERMLQRNEGMLVAALANFIKRHANYGTWRMQLHAESNGREVGFKYFQTREEFLAHRDGDYRAGITGGLVLHDMGDNELIWGVHT